MTRAIVAGALANKPLNGGNAWTRLQWIFGLRRLGVDVHLVEQLAPDACVDEVGALTCFEESLNLAYFRQVAEQWGLVGSMTLLLNGSDAHWGLSSRDVVSLAEDTNVLVNIGGHLTLESVRDRVVWAIYIDDDPGYTQYWYVNGQLGQRLDGYDAYYTIGANIGLPDCLIPGGGLPWRPLSPFVVLEEWPVADYADPQRFTTVASWRGAYGTVAYEGVTYGLKAHEFRKFVELPRRIRQRCEIALDIHPAETRDRELLDRHGWQVVDPRQTVSHPATYRHYLARSGAEFSAAQGIYVATESAWFSDRTACYLACGKPALVQDTGFGRHYPIGDGLLSFQTLDEAVVGAKRIAEDYPHHSRAARALAEAYFDSDVVLGRLLEEVE
jgi:hypothetical protein